MAARTAPNGAALLPEEYRRPVSQAMTLEWNTQAYLLMAERGEGAEPVPEPELWAALSGKHVFENGKFAMLRTPHSVATFSWGRQVMGMVLPLRGDLLISPNARSLIGQAEFAAEKGDPVVAQRVELSPDPKLLGVAGILSRYGKLEQRFGFLALPDGRTVYVDILALTGAERPTAVNLGTLGILNDANWPYHDGTRTVSFEGGSRTFAAAQAAEEGPVLLSSPWFNVDGLGICILRASGQQVYVPQPTPAMGRLEQQFLLNTIPAEQLAAAEPSSVIGHSVFVFYPGQSVEQTRAAASRCRLLSEPAARVVRLTLEDDTKVTIDLDELSIDVEAAAASR
jgi:hypothetical protein